jgi:UDP-N-acetylglucosamine transferase subunit ALG13
MIFVTVGSQLGFDRLIEAVDQWAGRSKNCEIFGQIGPSQYHPRNFQYVAFMEPSEFTRKVQEARAIVSHAGMGTILTALEMGKPILVMPRRADLQETRTEHQVATARKFQEKKGFLLALDEGELFARLDELGQLAPPEKIEPRASQELIDALRQFINND